MTYDIKINEEQRKALMFALRARSVFVEERYPDNKLYGMLEDLPREQAVLGPDVVHNFTA